MDSQSIQGYLHPSPPGNGRKHSGPARCYVGGYLLSSLCSVMPPKEVCYHIPPGLPSPHQPLHNFFPKHNHFSPTAWPYLAAGTARTSFTWHTPQRGDQLMLVAELSPCLLEPPTPASTAPSHHTDHVPAGAGPTHQPLCRVSVTTLHPLICCS